MTPVIFGREAVGFSGDVEADLRLAVIGSPRSGNTLVRSMLRSLYGLEERSVDSPDEIDWGNLPRRCVIQIHWYPLEPFLDQLEAHRIRVVVPIRHPFDVLLSWLNYHYYVHKDGLCPGRCGECDLVGVVPMSETFLSYARGYPGRTLLCYAPAWLKLAPSMIHKLSYERLVADPAATLSPLEEWVGEPYRRPVLEVAEENTIARKKSGRDRWQYHFWQGQPGLWRSMFTAAAARSIAERVPEPFDALGYECDPDETLGTAQADFNWLRLQLDSTREHLAIEKAKHRQTAEELSFRRDRIEAAESDLSDELRSLAETKRLLSATEARLVAANHRLATVQDLWPTILKFTQHLETSARRFREEAPIAPPIASRRI